MTRRAQSALPSGKAKAPTCCAAARILATLAAVLQPVLENRGRPAPSKSERMGRARVPVSPKAVRAGPEVDCRRRNRNGEGAHASRWVGARRGGSGRLKRVAASRRAERSEAEEVWRMVSRLSSATSELNESAIPVEKELGREFMPRSQWTRGRGEARALVPVRRLSARGRGWEGAVEEFDDAGLLAEFDEWVADHVRAQHREQFVGLACQV